MARAAAGAREAAAAAAAAAAHVQDAGEKAAGERDKWSKEEVRDREGCSNEVALKDMVARPAGACSAVVLRWQWRRRLCLLCAWFCDADLRLAASCVR